MATMADEFGPRDQRGPAFEILFSRMVGAGIAPTEAKRLINAMLHEQAEEIRHETATLREHGVLEPDKDRPAADAADQLDPYQPGKPGWPVVLPVDRYDRDPAAIAWATAKILRVAERAEAFSVSNSPRTMSMSAHWAGVASFIRSELIGAGAGCVIKPFDRRLPESNRYIERNTTR